QRVREFLLDTAILDELCAPLCEAVCRAAGAGDDGAGTLAWLERANLFLIPLDDSRPERAAGGPLRWYRYHSLFAEFLRGQLAASRAAHLSALHLAASEWFARQGRHVPAIDHALAAGAPARALPLMHQHVEDLLAQGRMRL